MSRFVGYMQGDVRDATRHGSAMNGLRVTVNGVAAGVRVTAAARGEVDHFHVYVTAGTGGDFPDRHIATVTHDPDKRTVEITPEGEGKN